MVSKSIRQQESTFKNITINPMRFIFIVLSFLKPFLPIGQNQSSDVYTYSVNLEDIVLDRIAVTLITPDINSSETAFVFPISVPGYYNIKLKYGDLITGFQAFDRQGAQLPAIKQASNRWVIKNASKLKTIKYNVDDVWEAKDSLSYWLPAENIFEENKVFLLNQGATMGYFEGMENLPIQVKVRYPKHLYPATGAQIDIQQKGLIKYSAKNYHDLTDKPVLFTATKPLKFKVAGTEVLISVHVEDESIKNEGIYKIIQPVFSKIANYLGNKLPVRKYAFLGYFYMGPIFASAQLEHNNSAVYIYPAQWDEKLLGSTFRENLTKTSYHEFFHILTPLNIHSEELLRFNFADPVMSKHLWLYEGMTEFLSYHVQVNQRSISRDSFYRSIENLVREMGEYRNDVSLIEISSKTYGELDNEYDNVELKGVLVNLLLDIKLRELSAGKYGVKDLMLDLAQKFGKEKAFKDDELFEIIASMTYPVIREHFTKYVEGIEPLPLKEYLAKVGLTYDENEIHIAVNPNATSGQKKLLDDWLFN